MKLKLCRFANIFNPDFKRSFIILIVAVLLTGAVAGFRKDHILAGITVVLIYVLLMPKGYPKYIELKDNEIYYVSPTTLTVSRGKGFFNVNVKYRVTDITNFELKQNGLERLFGVGHIVFNGKSSIDAGKHTDRIKLKDVHCVYGIRVKKHGDDIMVFAKTLNLI